MCDEDDDEVLLFECGASLAANAFSKFEEIRRSGKLCDVIIVASGVKLVISFSDKSILFGFY